MALYIPQSILHLARSLYVRPETYGPTYVDLAVVSDISEVTATCTYTRLHIHFVAHVHNGVCLYNINIVMSNYN